MTAGRALLVILGLSLACQGLAGRQLLQQFGVDLSQLNSLIDKAQKTAQSQAQSWSWPQWQSQPSSQPASQPQSQSPNSGFQLPQLPGLAGLQQLSQQTFKFSPMNNWQPASSPTQQAPSQSSPQASPARAPSGTGCAAGKQNGNDILALHNAYRAAHSAPALSWDSQLQSKAQSWANNLASNCQLYHSGSGENLASGFASWADAAYAWYVEYKQYNYNAPGYSAAVGHFTQMVWLGTTKLGCATANSKCSQGVIYVCQYDPPGNVNAPQYFRDNVRAPSGSCYQS
ncbi:CAP domain-containing protein [Haematococcus lacustris]